MMCMLEKHSTYERGLLFLGERKESRYGCCISGDIPLRSWDKKRTIPIRSVYEL